MQDIIIMFLTRAGMFLPVLLLALSLAQNGEASETASADKILACVADNMPRSSSIQNIEFRSQGVAEDFLRRTCASSQPLST